MATRQAPLSSPASTPASAHKATVVITASDGTMTGSSIYGFGGENELGTFGITVDRLKQVVFRC